MGECITNIISEHMDEYGFGVVRYGNRGRGGKTGYHTIWDNTDNNGNLYLDLNQITDPAERRKIFQALKNGEISPSQVKANGLKPIPNGIDLDTRTNVMPSQKDFNKYTSGAGVNKYKVLTFIKEVYPVISKILKGQDNTPYAKKYLQNVSTMLGILDSVSQNKNSLEIAKSLQNCCNNCLNCLLGLMKGNKQIISQYNDVAISDKDIMAPRGMSKFVVQIAVVLCGKYDESNINNELDFIGSPYSKSAAFYNNRQELANQQKNKDNLSFYKSVVPGTSVNVITLFPFKDFGGTELLKADRLSTGNDVIQKIYGKGENGFINNIEFDKGSKINFINMTLNHAKNVLQYDKFDPNYIICVPSTKNFNEDYIHQLGNFLGRPAYNAFIIKDWLSYKVDDATQKKIEQHLEFLKYYSGMDEFNNTVDAVKSVIKRGVANTALWMVSKVIKDKIFNAFSGVNIPEAYKNVLVKYFIIELGKTNNVYQSLFHGNDNNSLTWSQTNKYDMINLPPEILKHIQANSKAIISELQNTFKPYISGSKPLQIDIKKVTYKDTPQQMTSLVRSGAIEKSVLPGQELRPLVADVYVINEPQYELTDEGGRMIESMKQTQGPQLNEKTKVKIANQNILIFDDDIDTGSSLKLTINALNRVLSEAKITNTQLQCLTLFGKIN